MPDESVQKKNAIKELFSNVWVMVGAAGTVAAFIAAVWAIDDRYASMKEIESAIKESEARVISTVISEVQSEAGENRLALIEDMESRLDEYDYDISIKEANGEVPPADLVIKRNMLDRRIEGLKNNEDNNSNSN